MVCNTDWLLDDSVWHTDTLSFLWTLSIVYNLEETTFRKPTVLPSSGKEAPNLADPLDRAILSHWLQ